MSRLSNALDGLFRGDAEAWMACFDGTPRVNAQRGGLIEGHAAVAEWVADTARWFAEVDGNWTPGLDIEGERLVHESSLGIRTQDGVVDLPFVVVADGADSTISEVRTYHSTWPYTGTHSFRAPPVEKGNLEHVPTVFSDYIDRLVRTDVEPILESYAETGYIREPSGNRYKFQGPEQLADFYRGHILDAPPARFDLRTCTNAENIAAVEYAFAYGDRPLVGGICIMEHRDGEILAVRITDDVGAS